MNHLALVATAQQEQTMSSVDLVELINQIRRKEEIAAGESSRHFVELRHDHFMAKIASHPAIDGPKFRGVYRGRNGQDRPCYYLPEREVKLMVMSESLAVQAAVYDHMVELEKSSRPATVDLSDAGTLRALLLGYTEKVLALESKIESDAPKVKFAEVIRAMDAVCHIGDFCKTMKIGRNRLFRRMKEDKILMENRMPYQKYIDKGYFSVIEQKPYTNSKGETHTCFTTMVTGAGQVFLAKRYADMMEAS